jgi:hypothetical protein
MEYFLSVRLIEMITDRNLAQENIKEGGLNKYTQYISKIFFQGLEKLITPSYFFYVVYITTLLIDQNTKS